MDEHDWDKTRALHDRLDSSPFFYKVAGPEKETGYYTGRHIIGRDTVINKGVYLGSGEREAIVVDDEKYPLELNQAYELVIQRASLLNANLFETTNNVVRELLGGDQGQQVERAVQKIYDELDKRESPDPKVRLNAYLQRKAGLCRHRALLAAYILERAVREGKIKGKVSVDRNDNGRFGHAWARFTPHGGTEPTIIDPSLNYVGKLNDSPGKWNYKRPGE